MSELSSEPLTEPTMTKQPRASSSSTFCPYLDTINRSVLDFESCSRSCSITMECTPHVYACLICGKYYLGRGKQTPAYRHSVDAGHYVFVHLTNATFWCLPENYEIIVMNNPEDQETNASTAITDKDGNRQ
jgi:U4/U6.U5 tri-snRNP-associated protein 2